MVGFVSIDGIVRIENVAHRPGGRPRTVAPWPQTRLPDLPADRRPRHPQEGPYRPGRVLSDPADLAAPRVLRSVQRTRARVFQPPHGGRSHFLFLQAFRPRPPPPPRQPPAAPPRRA